MGILSINQNLPGLAGVVPKLIFIDTDDSLATITSTGYLNSVVQNHNVALSETDMILITTKDPASSSRSVGAFAVSYSGGNWSLGDTNNSLDFGLVDGELLIGKAGSLAQKANLIAGTNMSIVNGPGTITLNATGSGGGPSGVTILNTPGVSIYNLPVGVSSLIVEVIGAGGAGGSTNSAAGTGAAGAGGGSGGYVKKVITSPASSYTATVGAGGLGGGSINGNPGGASSFVQGALNLNAGGGLGGIKGVAMGVVATVSALGGAGGTASGGDLNIAGNQGGYGFGVGNPASIITAISGDGGRSFYGSGTKGVSRNSFGRDPGIAATSAGDGGTGALAIDVASADPGGDGADGLIVIWEYS